MKKILCLLFAVLVAVAFSSCQGVSKPEDAVTGYLEAAKASDKEKMNSFLNPENISAGNSSGTSSEVREETFLWNSLSDYIKGNNKKVTYRIQNTENQGGSASVTVNFQFVDASKILEDSVADDVRSGSQSSGDSEAEIAKRMQDKIKTTKETFANKAVKIKCVKTDGKWYLDKTDDSLENIFSSNLVSAEKEIPELQDRTSSSSSPVPPCCQ